MPTERIHIFSDSLSHAGISDVATLREVHAKHVLAKLHEVDTITYAEINHGRWLINCECNGAAVTCPKARIGCCFDCGRVHTNVVFPSRGQRGKIEKTLLARPMPNRNWKRGETLKFLLAENVEHDIKEQS
jgi:hypothetical protein